jgi:uncharacterized protein YfaP (DUF2135 family)
VALSADTSTSTGPCGITMGAPSPGRYVTWSFIVACSLVTVGS